MTPDKHKPEIVPSSKVENIQNEPGTFDLVIIDGRWAQIRAGGVFPNLTITWLDSDATGELDFNEYDLDERFKFTKVDQIRSQISQTEFNNIRWDPEQGQNSKIGLSVPVFGRYKRKKQA